ncbi:TPA: hypothetical protein EYP45_01635, partial [Candidatus Peregrinibacteria bacterium]|nr:hypothetical protein [Candidatus Peregrinibacteria bacterium]
MSIKNYIYIGGVVMLASMHLTFAEVSDYSGSLRLKYEYQHLVIQNVDIFVDKKTEKEMKNTIKNYSFCFADDIDESVIEYKNKKFISQNNNLNNIEKLNVLIDNSGEENNTNNNIINKQKIRKYVIKKIVPFLN